jgi:hypothetical protein
MIDSIVIQKLEKLTNKIQKLTSDKGSYQSEYELDNCASEITFMEWVIEKVIPGIQSDFENYILDEYSPTLIKLIGYRDEDFRFQTFMLEEVNITSDDVSSQVIGVFSSAISEMSSLFEGDDIKNTFIIQLWDIE